MDMKRTGTEVFIVSNGLIDYTVTPFLKDIFEGTNVISLLQTACKECSLCNKSKAGNQYLDALTNVKMEALCGFPVCCGRSVK